MSRPKSLPRFLLHKQSGQAYVCIHGHQILLGKWESPESKARYARDVARMHAISSLPIADSLSGESISITTPIACFWEHAAKYYRRPDGTPASELAAFQHVLRLLNHLYGDTIAIDFGPKRLKAIREAMIRPLTWTSAEGKTIQHKGWSRTFTNHQINRIRHVFKWAVSEELLQAATFEALKTVPGLVRGRTIARETAPVRPVPDELVLAVLSQLPRPVRAIVELSSLAGARGGELVIMRKCDIDFSDDTCWIYRPATHKTLHHGHERRIPLGRRCQEILSPFLSRDPAAFLFSPAEWEVERRALQHQNRKTPPGQGNEIGTHRAAKPRKAPGERYTTGSYRRTIARGCVNSFPQPAELARGRVKTRGERQFRKEKTAEWRQRLGQEKWAALLAWRREHHFHPHQLRHAAATRLRKQFGLEAAGVVLGQKTMAATMMYAEADEQLASKVMAEVG